MTVTLSAIGISTGNSRRVADLADSEPSSRPGIERLLANGFEAYIETDRNTAEMAFEAITDTLRAGVVPKHLDAVIFATESWWDPSPTPPRSELRMRDAFLCALIDAGLVNPQIYGNWMSACGNSLMSIRLAAGLVTAGLNSNVLVVLSDRVEPGGCRLMRRGLAIYSDLAATCVVSSGGPGFRLGPMVTQPALALSMDRSDFTQRAQYVMKALASLKAALARSTLAPLSSYKMILTDNLSAEYVLLLGECLSIAPDRLIAPTRPAVAHAFSADWLLSLREMAAQGRIEAGDRIGILNTSNSVFTFAELEAS